MKTAGVNAERRFLVLSAAVVAAAIAGSRTILLLPPAIFALAPPPPTIRHRRFARARAFRTHPSAIAQPKVGRRIPINESYEGLSRIHSDPDVYVVKNFLDDASCRDLVNEAKGKTMDVSPVAYAGWTTDFKDLLELATKGPVTWLAILIAWYQTNETGGNQLDLVIHGVQNFVILFVLAAAGIAAFTKSRADGLQSLRTSTSTTIDDLGGEDGSNGAAVFVRNTAKLFGTPAEKADLREEAKLFEAPTVIRYEPDQVLAPHYDANRSAETEDSNRGGQTLATILVYLNDVERGGKTRFGKLPCNPATNDGDEEDEEDPKLTVRPKMGDALLFFPADANGNFDDRLEHEGMPAIDEKWIARIWRHEGRVPPPFGLARDALDRI